MSDGSAGQTRHTFEGLDGLRGIAALMVFFYHGSQSGLFAAYPHGAYLAVDLFFAISGFVIAYAYEPRLKAGLDAWTFLKQRWVRLYPLYIIGVAIGVVYFFVYHHWNQIPPPAGSVAAMAPQLVMAPSGPGLLYSLNPAAWSLFAELCVNVLFALIWRWLTPFVFALLFIGSAILMAIAAIGAQHLDVGWSWASAVGGIARACFGFFAGVLLYRLHARGVRAPAAPIWLLFVVVFVLLSAPTPAGTRPYADLAIAYVVSPLLVFWAASAIPQGLARTASQALGRSSYALYAIHAPALGLIGAAAAQLMPDLLRTAPMAIYVVITLLFVGAALVLEQFYDRPARQWLGDRLLKRKAPARAAAIGD